MSEEAMSRTGYRSSSFADLASSSAVAGAILRATKTRAGCGVSPLAKRPLLSSSPLSEAMGTPAAALEHKSGLTSLPWAGTAASAAEAGIPLILINALNA
jgi:hypothetical protein